MNSLSFTYHGKSYTEIFEAFWDQRDACITLFSTNDSEPSRSVSENLIELVELLEASRIPVRRVGELNRFDLHKIAGVLGRWLSTFEYASKEPEGSLEQALTTRLFNGQVFQRGIFDLVFDDQMQRHLVDAQQQRFKVLATIRQDDGEYLFTDRHCWCPSEQVLQLASLNERKGVDLTMGEMLEYLKTQTKQPHDGEGTLIETLEKACEFYDLSTFVSKPKIVRNPQF